MLLGWWDGDTSQLASSSYSTSDELQKFLWLTRGSSFQCSCWVWGLPFRPARPGTSSCRPPCSGSADRGRWGLVNKRFHRNGIFEPKIDGLYKGSHQVWDGKTHQGHLWHSHKGRNRFRDIIIIITEPSETPRECRSSVCSEWVEWVWLVSFEFDLKVRPNSATFLFLPLKSAFSGSSARRPRWHWSHVLLLLPFWLIYKVLTR